MVDPSLGREFHNYDYTTTTKRWPWSWNLPVKMRYWEGSVMLIFHAQIELACAPYTHVKNIAEGASQQNPGDELHKTKMRAPHSVNQLSSKGTFLSNYYHISPFFIISGCFYLLGSKVAQSAFYQKHRKVPSPRGGKVYSKLHSGSV